MNTVINEDVLLYNSSSTVTHETVVHEIVESLMDGVLILTEERTVVYANSCARQLCRKLAQDPSFPSNQVPDCIWYICEALIDSRDVFPDRRIILEEDITLSQSTTVRIRVRWMEMAAKQLYLMVTLEDRFQAIKNLALTEAHKYGLTAREAEVWFLKRANLTYKAIAAELHIAIDTVRKHVKNIHAKRDAFRWANE